MNKEKLNKLQEVINDQLDLIEMNVARINNKDYFGLDFELLKYIRNLENQLDTANKKLEETKEYINKNIRHEYRNGRNNEFYLELNENKLKQLQSIIGSD